MDKEAKWGLARLSPKVQKAIKTSVEGETPFLAKPFEWAASKVVGKKKVKDFLWNKVQKPILGVDMEAGRLAQKATKKLTGKPRGIWKEKMVLQTGKASKKGGHRTKGEEHEFNLASSPVTTAGKYVFPFLGAMKAQEILDKRKKAKEQRMDSPIVKEADLKKVSQMLLDLKVQRTTLQKEAKATELLYKQAEAGHIRFPQTFEEYQEKVAELVDKDLRVVEEAIKMASSADTENVLGGLDGHAGAGSNARQRFENVIIEG